MELVETSGNCSKTNSDGYRISLTLQPYSCFVYTKVAIFWCKCSIMVRNQLAVQLETCTKSWLAVSSPLYLKPKIWMISQIIFNDFHLFGRVAWNHRNHFKVFKRRSLYWWVMLESCQQCLSSFANSLKMFRSYPKLSDFSICILGDGSTWGHHVSTIQQAVSAECQGLERCKSDAACLLKQSWRNNVQHASSTGCELQFCWRADRWVFRILKFFLWLPMLATPAHRSFWWVLLYAAVLPWLFPHRCVLRNITGRLRNRVTGSVFCAEPGSKVINCVGSTCWFFPWLISNLPWVTEEEPIKMMFYWHSGWWCTGSGVQDRHIQTPSSWYLGVSDFKQWSSSFADETFLCLLFTPQVLADKSSVFLGRTQNHFW